ncbi:hypothetical protein MTO96_035432, partial [Rhipicephalus appendiculatus]
SPGSVPESPRSASLNAPGEVHGRDTSAKVTTPGEKAGGSGPSLTKASPSPKGSNLNAPDSKPNDKDPVKQGGISANKANAAIPTTAIPTARSPSSTGSPGVVSGEKKHEKRSKGPKGSSVDKDNKK